jgi:O-antigen ligase
VSRTPIGKRILSMPPGQILATVLAIALPALVLTWERSAGLVGLAWLVFCATQWRSLAAYPARITVLCNPACLGFLGFWLVMLLLGFLHGTPSRAFDNPSRFVLVLPVVVAIACFKPSARSWFYALAGCGIYVGSLALVQTLVFDEPVARGFTNQNKFGFICATFGLFGVAMLRLPVSLRPPLSLVWLGILGALFALVMSSTRGAWLAFLGALFTWLLLSRGISARSKAVGIGATLLIVAGLAVTNGSVVQERLEQMVDGLDAYHAGTVNSSVGERIEMWHGAVMMFEAHPLIGVGPGQYQEANQDLIAQGRLSPVIAGHGHPHNEYLAALASGGILGFFGLLLALLGPLVYFVRHARYRDPRSGARPDAEALRPVIALGGSLFVVATAIFAFTDAYFYIHYATVYYALMVAILAGFVEANRAPR